MKKLETILVYIAVLLICTVAAILFEYGVLLMIFGK